MIDLLNKEIEDLIKELNKRKIKFRGKCLRNNQQWVYGSYVYHLGTIQDENQDFDIDLNTLGQYTGIIDVNGKEIYEGDIVKGNFPYAKQGFITWDKKRCGMYVKPISHLGKAAYDKYYKLNACKVEVVGNIYDNPELLEN